MQPKPAIEVRGQMVKFINVVTHIGVTIAPLKGMPFLPRIGKGSLYPSQKMASSLATIA